jgi:anti-sigma-K factor RskA
MTGFPDSSQADEMENLIALHAIDALDHDERVLVESAVADDALLAAELDGYRAVAAALAEAVETAPPTPSPDVWRSINAAIQGRNLATPDLAPVVELRRRQRWSRVSTIVSIAAVTVSIGLAVRVIDLQNAAARPDLSRVAAEKVTEAGAEVVTLTAAEGHAGEEARIVLGADGVGYVLSDTLPALPAGRTYQLWAIVPDTGEPRVISAGVLGNDPGIAPFQAVGEIVGFAITDEVAGGVPVSEGETVAVWLADA